MKWQQSAEFEHKWKAWGDEHLVFHGGTADTHLLNPFAASVLRCFQRETLSLSELADNLLSEYGVIEIKDSDLKEIVRQLYNLSLIEPYLA